ncbi:MAG: hypothetical protein GX605_11785 [Chloroflexi bacterium]|nr:hypothetical protein [Chloroflexota bacterium]
MGWKPEHYEVDLSDLGEGASAVVVVNPPGKVVREYWALMPEMAAVDTPTAEQQERYFAVLAQLVVEVRRPGGVTPLATPEAVRRFEDEDDPLLAAVALSALWEERKRRRDEAVKRFRTADR